MQVLLDFLEKYGLFLGLVFGVVLLLVVSFLIFKKIHQRAFKRPVLSTTLAPVENEDNQKQPKPREAKREGNSLKTGVVSYRSEQEETPIVNQEPPQATHHEPISQLETPDSLKNPIQPLLDDEPMENVEIKESEPDETQITETILVEESHPQPIHYDKPEPKITNETMEPLPIKKDVPPMIKRTLPPLDDDIKPKKAVKSTPKPTPAPKKSEPAVTQVIKKKAEPKKKTPPKYHVLYRPIDDKWYVKKEGSETIISVLETQREAISFATIKALTSDSDVIVHRKDGKIRKKATFKDVIDSETDE